MMNKTAIVSSILIALFCIFGAAHDAFAVDPPHNGQNSLNMTMQCTVCHYDTSVQPLPDWVSWPTTTDNTYFNNLCRSCHIETGSLDPRYVVKTHSSTQMATGNYPVWTVECRVCHNPHYQDQISSYPTDTTSNLFTGTIFSYVQAAPTATFSTINVTATNLVPNAWIDYILIPNTLYPTKMYRILSNTANSFKVIGSINGRYALPGSTFGVRLSSMLLAQLRTPLGATETVKFFTSDPSLLNSYASSTVSSNVTGICQVCHTQTHSFNRWGVLGSDPSIQEGPNHPPGVVAGGQKCTQCHIHTAGFKGECNSCHGSPPISAATLVFRDKSGVTVTSDSPGAGAHDKHVNIVGYNCATCHTGGMLGGQGEGDNRINIGFYLQATNTLLGGNYDGKSGRSIYGYATGTGSTTSVTSGGLLQCTNLYCHSSGQGSTANNPTPVYSAPVWTNPATGVCGTCHQTKTGHALGPISSGSHTTHMNVSGMGCDDCHTGAAADASSYASSAHVNKNIDVANSYTAGGFAGNGYGTCTTNCHGTTSPVWGANTTGAQCVRCHGVAGASVAQYGANTDLAAPGYISTAPVGTGRNTAGNTGVYSGDVSNDPKVGAHNAHLRGIGGYKTNGIVCTDCHAVASLNDAGHMNGSTTFAWSTLATNNGALSPNYNTGTGVCSNVYCHGASFAVATQGTDITPVWTDGTYLVNAASTPNSGDCGKCHQSPAFASSYNHSGISIGVGNCNACHGHDGAGSTHIDGTLQAQGGYCDSCHDYDVDGNGDWGKNPKAIEGFGAHAAHISHLKALSKVTLSAAADTFGGSAYREVCGVCHTTQSTLHSMNNTTNVRSITFSDGSLTYQFAVSSGSPTYAGVTGLSSASTAKKTCSNISCHFQVSPTWQGL